MRSRVPAYAEFKNREQVGLDPDRHFPAAGRRRFETGLRHGPSHQHPALLVGVLPGDGSRLVGRIKSRCALKDEHEVVSQGRCIRLRVGLFSPVNRAEDRGPSTAFETPCPVETLADPAPGVRGFVRETGPGGPGCLARPPGSGPTRTDLPLGRPLAPRSSWVVPSRSSRVTETLSGYRKGKKTTCSNTLVGYSSTSAYSLTAPAARPGSPSSNRPRDLKCH